MRNLYTCVRRKFVTCRQLIGILTFCVLAVGLFQVASWLMACDDTWVYPHTELAWFLGRQDVERKDAAAARNPPCVDDCAKLQALFQTPGSWPSDKPKALIYYLIMGNRVSNELKRSLSTLDEQFNNAFRYPVVIFYNESDQLVNEDAIRSLTKSSVFFQKVVFEVPPFMNERSVPEHGCLGRFPVEYRHMCRFQALSVYEQPIMSAAVGAQFAWRLDDDSYIMHPIKFDIFGYMRDSGYRYAYLHENIDNYECVCGLWEAAGQYVTYEALKPAFFYEWPKKRIFYNNFEISDLSLWRSTEYRKFIAFTDRMGGIYYRRWGDAPIKTIAVSLFVNRNQTFRFQSIGYRHHGLLLL